MLTPSSTVHQTNLFGSDLLEQLDQHDPLIQLAIKIINRLNKLAKAYGIQQRRTYEKEVKALRLNIRHFRHVKRRAKARKALKRLRTIAPMH